MMILMLIGSDEIFDPPILCRRQPAKAQSPPILLTLS